MTRKKKSKEKSGETANKKEQHEEGSAAIDGNDDDGLLQFAAGWAARESHDERKNHGEKKDSKDVKSKTPRSLHITQLDFGTNEVAVRTHFSTAGCLLSSVRLVYDRDLNGKKLFRGVAFIDVSDQNSYDKALSLHRSELLGRKINVRPTRTKEELLNIVQRTRTLVKERINASLDGKADGDSPPRKRRDDRKRDGASKSRPTKKAKASHEKKTDKSSTKGKEKKHTDINQKLSKQERNKKAAILMQKRRRK